ncbi:NirA family protein [Mangrovibrevibacter kandeliae]|uniref:NirA family protein n=1 Tax=Mangrovibrevibacter kandeliae TaxID=2968473 RepID=UPI002118B2B5|nr:NirA family protein [Aurantimonas sp. CSK15Z-1]MCQ8782077.1 NirA family protein [Aurantimonas sp. CSK15Z-1]
MSEDFSSEQRRWLEGFASGAAAVRALPAPGGTAEGEPAGPDAAMLKAQNAQVARGGKLVDPEKWKRDEHPLDAYARLKAEALAGTKPKPADNFRWRYHGLFHVAPAQDSYMCRLRIANGILSHWQLAGIADLAERLAGGYAHVTTRANLQLREIVPQNGPALVEGLIDLGIVAKGSGADNIRNVTGSATAGIDPVELHDTRADARAWHHHVLNSREMYDLPRKFNVAFDGGGLIPTLEDTNDIGFQAIAVGDGASVSSGVQYRLTLGGITGHKDFARDTGVVLPTADAVRVADAIVQVFVEQGDRTNRNKARLKYVLDDWGFERFVAAVEEKLGAPLARLDASHAAPRAAVDRQAHIGVHRQKQPGLNWIGVALTTGRMSADQMRAVAAIAAACGDGDVRLTVWQNLILSGIPDAKVGEAQDRLVACGLDWKTTAVRAGLIACTGNRGCKFANSDTKGHAAAIADHLDARGLDLDQPINIHLTGCPNSCAQHYIGDIGLVGTKVTVSEDGDQVEGYHLHVGGGFGTDAAIATLLYPDLKAEDLPETVERLLRAYLVNRAEPTESFAGFSRRVDPEAFKAAAEAFR